MIFVSIEFAIFLVVVFLLYWIKRWNNFKIQNILLLAASYFFYGMWDWRFLIILVLISLANFGFGLLIDINEINKRKKFWLISGLILNIGILAVFKYYNFFIDSFIDLISLFGYNLPRSTTKILLPVGISFYVFLSLSYLIDIYKKKLNAERNIVSLLLSLSFFPIILAGPIQRPAALLPQINQRREFQYEKVADGLRQILWGLFAKVVIADNLAVFVDDFFTDYNDYTGSTLLLGAIFFTIQIYADFSGYSDMSIGIAKLFGFNLVRNFAYPYFSRDISEFWKRWHISLVTFFRDYVFLPISFALVYKIRGEKVLLIKVEHLVYIIASLVVWFLTGLWHGANYTYVIWGLFHGVLLIFYHLQRNSRKRVLKKLGCTNDNIFIVSLERLITLALIVVAWIFFRSSTVPDAIDYLTNLFSKSLFYIPAFSGKKDALILALFIIFYFLIEWRNRDRQFATAGMETRMPLLKRWAFYLGLIMILYFFGYSEETLEFIYFQF